MAIEQDGAHAIVFGFTGMLGHADAMQRALLARGHDIPVIDPLPAGIRMAQAIVALGLAHSKLTYPAPPETLIVGYHLPPLSFWAP